MAGLSHSRSDCQLSAIRQLESNLVDVLQHEINVVLGKAWSVTIVGEQVRALAQTTEHSGRFKAEKFVAVIRDRVKTDPGTFDVLLNILRSSPSLEFLAEALENKLCNEHRAAADHMGGVPSLPSMTSTPKLSTNLQSRYRDTSASNAGEYHTRTPPRGRKKRHGSSSDGPAHDSLFSGQPKLATRDDTDEEFESGFQDEESTHVAASNSQLNESEKVDGDMYTSGPPNNDHVSFKAPVEAQSDYLKPFSKTADAEPDIEAKLQSAEPDNDLAVVGVVGQELQHDTTSQQQIVSGHGIQTTAEGWADKATFYVNQGAARETEMANEIEELKTKIASLKQQVDANKDESQRVEKMEEHIQKQKAKLDDCKKELATKEGELKQLKEKRKADIKAAEENLKKERDDHEQKIAQVEEEVKSLQNQLREKNAEADNLRHNYDDLKKEHDELKKTTEAKIRELKEKLMAKTEEATKLKDQYQQLEENRKNEIAQLKEKYKKQISELKELVESQKEQARLKEGYLEMKFKSEYQEKEIQRLKEESELKLEIKELEMKLAQKQTQVEQMQREDQARQHKEATEKMKQQAKEEKVKMETEKAKLEEQMKREKAQFEEQIKLERTQSERKLQETVDSYEEKLQRLSSVLSTSSGELSLSIPLRSSTDPGSNSGNKDDMNTITEEVVHLSISNSDKED